ANGHATRTVTLRERSRYANGHATRTVTLRERSRYANGHATRTVTLRERISTSFDWVGQRDYSLVAP
ncbi:MAG: hypothetical protein F6K56_29320, partial [Moorea sp. SIO3G5]|nr:hypothetical protein [Moorena sp. SIO3G5]